MLNELEDFIRNNRDGFDDEMPSKNLWHSIEQQVLLAKQSQSLEAAIANNVEQFNSEEPAAEIWDKIALKAVPKKQARVFTLREVIKWSAVAAAIFIALTSVYFIVSNKNQAKPDIASGPTITKPAPIEVPEKDSSIKDEELGAIPTQEMAANEPILKNAPDIRDRANKFTKQDDEETALFKVIAAKQKELKVLTKEKPYLYQEFTADLRTLESSYGVLKKQLSQTNNSDVIITAMMQNLELQTELLARQLTIINNIKKNNKNEKIESIYD
jgi:hypothetical protein